MDNGVWAGEEAARSGGEWSACSMTSWSKLLPWPYQANSLEPPTF